MKIATWNINGVRARVDSATSWLKDVAPDVLCLQEIKSEDSVFPAEAFEDLGYNVIVHGQKGFNGVAVLSKLPIDEATPGLPGDHGDEQARFLEVVVSVPDAALTIVSLYLPNGNPIGSDKFDYKLAWMERLQAYAAKRLDGEEAFVLGGRLQCHSGTARRAISRSLERRRAVSAAIPARLPAPVQSGTDRRLSRLRRPRRQLHLLGLSGRCLAEEPRHPHRPHAAVTSGG